MGNKSGNPRGRGKLSLKTGVSLLDYVILEEKGDLVAFSPENSGVFQQQKTFLGGRKHDFFRRR